MHRLRLPLVLAVAALVAPIAGAQSPPAPFSYEVVYPGPTSDHFCSMAFAPDGRLFLADRTSGAIKYLKDGVLSSTWATIPKTGVLSSEQGLLGIAIDPNFLINGYVYVYYTRTATITENVVARLQELGGVGTGLTVISPVGGIPSTTIHNGGRLVFGVDGKLYVGVGDRSVSSTAQDKTVLNGKILRMNTDGTAPADNPFATDATFHPLVWTYGHRNQYGLTVNPISGDIFQTENGLNTRDEINHIVKGGNYGWPIYEGTEPVPDPTTVDPLATYAPTPDPTGTCFYRGNNYPAGFENNWFFIKYSSNLLQRVQLDPTQTFITTQSQFDDLPGSGFDVLSGPDGNLWYLTNDGAATRGGNEVGRYISSTAPNPAANITPVSNQIIGGSLTFGFNGTNGDTVFSWVSVTKLGAPLSTPFGDFWVPADLMLPSVTIVGDNRQYLGAVVPSLAALSGITIYMQAADVPLAAPIKLTNPAQITLN